MDSWWMTTLGEVVEFRPGSTPPREVGRYWSEGGHPWATIADLNHDPVVTTNETVSDAGRPLAGRMAKRGTVLMSFKLTIGRVARAGFDLQTNEAIVSILPIGHFADADWLYHALPYIAVNAVTDKAVKGATLNQAKLLSLPVNLPPLEEQRWIAEILDTIDETIQASERVIAKHKRIRSGLASDLLNGKFEGAQGESWTRCRIGDFADVQRGASPGPIDNPAWFATDGPGWIRISDVTAAGDHLLRTRDCLSPAGAARSRRTFPGDVIMSISGTIGVAIIVGIEACYHQGLVRINHDRSIIPEFLVMLLAHHKEDFIKNGQTGTQANINSTIVAETEVTLPNTKIQLEIVEATSAVRSAIRANEEQRDKLCQLRDGLAADLLSGRVRTVSA